MSELKTKKARTNKRTFKVGDLELAVVRPSAKQLEKAQIFRAKKFREAVEGGAVIRDRMDREMRAQNLWDDTKQARYAELSKAILAGELKLAKGKMKLSEAKELAMTLRKQRSEWSDLRSAANQLDHLTAEGQAVNAEFNWLVANCTVYADTGKPYFRDHEEYAERADDDPAVLSAATEFGKLYYGLEDDHQGKFPENAWLRKFGYADRQGRLVREDGKFVDEKGRLINDQGELVDEEGRKVDMDGNPLDDEGNYLSTEEAVFYDDDGNVVQPKEDE